MGQRASGTALDGNNYSRALQAYTAHYYRITCGGSVDTGTFTTANIPMGNTQADPPQLNPANQGGILVPTQFQNRAQKIVDPQTGALLKRVSLDIERHGDQVGGLILSFGAFVRNCGLTLRTAPDGTHGFLCTFFNNQASGALYYIIPATGEVRALGTIFSGYPYVNGSGNVYTYNDSGTTFRSTYVGDFQEVADPNANAAFSPQVVYSGPLADLMHQFDSDFDTSVFGCNSTGADAGEYALVTCFRAGQDSYGWVGAFYGGDGRVVDLACPDGNACPRIVAAMKVVQAPASRWCGLHNIQMVPGYPLISINYSRLSDFGGAIGNSAQVATLVNAVAPSDTTITISGQLAPLNSDTYRQNLAVGDLLAIAPNQQEVIRILTITPQLDGTIILTVTRDVFNNGASSFTAGTNVWGMCAGWGGMGYWKFLNDSHGTDATGTNVINDYFWGYGGHMDNGPLGRVEEWETGWQAVYGSIIDNINTPISLRLEDSPTFAGIRGLASGNTTSKHPSYQQHGPLTSEIDKHWFLDMTPFDGGNIIADNARTALLPPLHYATLNWVASTSPGVTGYNVYRGDTSGGPYTKLTNTPVTLTTYIDYAVTAGQTYYYVVTAIDDSSNESTYSNQAIAVVPTTTSQLWKYYVAPGYGGELQRKRASTAATSGGAALIDVSGPNSIISDQADDSYKFCVVDVTPGECRLGSQVGDIYINSPNVRFNFCTGGDGPNPTNQDLCVENIGPYYQAVTQLFLSQSGTADATAHSRVITRALSGLKGGTYYSLAKALPDASWTLFTTADPNTQNTNVWMAKMPPFVASDSVDRSTFVRAPISITAPNGVATAEVEFGYAEFGTDAQHYCTTRKEKCIAVSATVDDTNPFFFGSETYSRMPCAVSCTITLPVLPAHVAYYQVRFYDSGGSLVASGDQSIAVESRSVTVN